MQRRRLLVGITVALLTTALGWWSFFWPGSGLEDSVDTLNSHPQQFDRILGIVQANPHLCFVSLEAIRNCPHEPERTAQDQEDYEALAALMREVHIDSLHPYRKSEWELVDGRTYRTTETGKLLYIEFTLFDGTVIPWRQPITGVWYDQINVQQRRGCIPANRPNWYACPSRMVLFP